MSIMWKYLDKRSATIAAIKDYDAMQFIINSTDDEIKRTYEKMTSVGSPKWDGMPHAHNPRAGEERLISAISEIDILRERYRQAVEYMDWFKPAWEQLTDDERYCLETFYGDGNTYGSSAAYYIGPADHSAVWEVVICKVFFAKTIDKYTWHDIIRSCQAYLAN